MILFCFFYKDGLSTRLTHYINNVKRMRHKQQKGREKKDGIRMREKRMTERTESRVRK